MDNVYKEYGFLKLVEEREIEIPIIQRDYAQGRIHPKTNEVRENFLSALIEKLEESIDDKNLVLDFVYGSTKTIEKKVFVPLDGQQRLTTLFLLHWFLCPKDELNLLQKDRLSKFSYQTRISSKDFCHKLVNSDRYSIEISINREIQHLKDEIAKKEIKANSLQNSPEKEKLIKDIEMLKESSLSWTLSKGIINQSWFMWGWKKDPTVKAMLVMLNAMDKKLSTKSEEEKLQMWNNLKQGRIVFHLLPLEEFELTDELYVKMNARGKELSAFDIFKSTLEEQMRLNKVSEEDQQEWRKNIDSCWIDIFWNKIKKDLESIDMTSLTEDEKYRKKREIVDSVEESYLRYFKRMMVFHLFNNQLEYDSEQIKYLPWETKKEDSITMDQIRDYSVREDVLNLMPFLTKIHFFGESFFHFIIDSMKSLIYKTEDEKRKDGSEQILGLSFEIEDATLFGEFVSPKITYETRIQFYALLQFFKYNSAQDTVSNSKLEEELHNWMRIVRNLSTTTNVYSFNTSADLGRALKSLQKWALDIYKNNLYPSVINLFASEEKLDGFAGFQIDEERTKARLILSDNNGWKSEIEKIEEHPYFFGQIPFLLWWSNQNEEYNIDKFREYSRKISRFFDKGGLKEKLRHRESHIFRNAMMCANEYYLRNDSFVNSVDKSRDNSWKRYLRENSSSHHVKGLLDLWDDEQINSPVDFCKDIINNNKPTDWRKYFIEYPKIYNEMYDHCISIWNWRNKEIALLSKVRRSSRHKELKTYYWYLKFDGAGYDHSHAEDYPFSAFFCKEDEQEFYVEYAGSTKEYDSKYIVSSNFNPQLQEMSYNNETQCWESYFSTIDTENVEKLLEKLKKL